MGTDMIIDCDRCEVRGDACAECVITVLLGAPPGGLELDCADRRALDTLAAGGIVPQLQLVERCDENHDGRPAASGGSDAISRNRAERSVGDVQRSDRHVG